MWINYKRVTLDVGVTVRPAWGTRASNREKILGARPVASRNRKVRALVGTENRTSATRVSRRCRGRPARRVEPSVTMGRWGHESGPDRSANAGSTPSTPPRPGRDCLRRRLGLPREGGHRFPRERPRRRVRGLAVPGLRLARRGRLSLHRADPGCEGPSTARDHQWVVLLRARRTRPGPRRFKQPRIPGWPARHALTRVRGPDQTSSPDE